MHVSILFIYTSFNVIKVAAVSTKQVMQIYVYMGVSIYWPMSALYMFCVCDIKSEYHMRDI